MLATTIAPIDASSASGPYHGGQLGRAASGSSGAERAPPRGPLHRRTATKSSACSSSPDRSAKSRRDRRREAVVKRSCDAEGGVDPVPACAQRELGSAACARKSARAARRRRRRSRTALELLRAVLAQVPGVVRLGRAWRGERQHVRRGDVGRPAVGEHGPEVAQQRQWRLDVLDGLEEDQRVAGLGVALDEVADEANAGRLYLRRACSCASGLASTPVTSRARRASTSTPYPSPQAMSTTRSPEQRPATHSYTARWRRYQ